jgi:hypothetical protein
MQDGSLHRNHDLSHDFRKFGFSAPIIKLMSRAIFAIVRKPMEQLTRLECSER